MRNIVITTKALVNIPDDAVINADGSITIGDATYKDICISVSRYETGKCVDADVLISDLTIELNTNLIDATKKCQRIWPFSC